MKMKNLDLITKFEGFRSEPYLCPASIPTIGYGSTRYADGTKVSMQDKAITEDEALELMKQTLVNYENAVTKYVTVPLTQNQFDALVSFVYNIGEDNFKKSTLVKKLNTGDYESVGTEIIRWNRAGGKVLAGLIKRREEEKDLFMMA